MVSGCQACRASARGHRDAACGVEGQYRRPGRAKRSTCATSTPAVCRGDVAGAARGLNFMGGPDTIVKQMKAFHDQCGAGVVDLFFQQPSGPQGSDAGDRAVRQRSPAAIESSSPLEGWRRRA